MVEGYLEGINTQSFNAGDQLYLSGTVAGGFTATKPQAPIHLVYVGVVTKKSAGDGHVFVKVQNGYELGELHDVLITSPTNNQVLAYDSATSLWKNATNAPDGVTSITAVSPLTGGTITSTGSIGLDQTALSITKSQVSDFTSGTVTSASTAQQAGTAVYAVNSGTAVYSTTSGTAVYSANSGTAVTISGSITKSQVSDFTSGTVAQADNSTTSGTSVYATNSGTAVYATTSGTATYATNAGTAVFATTSGTATYATNSGTAVFATNASTAVSVSGSAITQSQVVNLVSDLAGKANLTGGNAFTGAQTVTSSATGQVPLTLAGTAGQTANLFSVTGTVGTTSIDSQGLLVNTGPVQTNGLRNPSVQTVLSLATSGINVFSNNPTAGNVGLVLRGAASQSANLQEWQSSAASILTRISSSGQFVSDQQTFVGSGATSISNSRFNLATGSSSVIGQVIRGAASQTANLQEWQDSAGTRLISVNPAGSLVFSGSGSLLSGTNGRGLFITNDATIVPITIRGAASQSANLLQLQASDASVVANFTAPVNNVSRLNLGGTDLSATLGITVHASGGVGQVIRAAASQTANLQEWQNSAGTVVANMQAGGNLKASNVATLNSLIQLAQANSGGVMIMGRATAQYSSPGANSAALYFRDGTTAGTLKLVVRAGAAGAETTILDNIPQ
jgi:hypothetical protein